MALERERGREREGGARGTGGVSSEWEVGWRTPTVECCLDLVVEETTFREEGEQEGDHLQGGRRAPSGRKETTFKEEGEHLQGGRRPPSGRKESTFREDTYTTPVGC